jgi:hypothetical protein
MLRKKKIIKSAFRILHCYPGDFDLIGFKTGEMYSEQTIGKLFKNVQKWNMISNIS